MSEHENCMKKPNLCNDLVYTFGSNKGCRAQNHPLETTGGTMLGYAVDTGTLRSVRVVWGGVCEADEVIVVTRNGEDIAWVKLEGESGTNCVELTEDFCGCDVINVVSRAGGVQGTSGTVPGAWIPAGCLTVTVGYENKCDIELLPEGDGVAEAIDTTGTTDVNVGATWFTRKLDTERNNTLGMFATFLDGDDAYQLKYGIYIIHYTSSITFDQSVNVAYKTKLQTSTNGGGWIDYPQSGGVDFNLSGDDGNVEAGRTVTLKVAKGDTVKVRIQEMITQDTSIQNATGGAGMVIERVANGVKLS